MDAANKNGGGEGRGRGAATVDYKTQPYFQQRITRNLPIADRSRSVSYNRQERNSSNLRALLVIIIIIIIINVGIIVTISPLASSAIGHWCPPPRPGAYVFTQI